MRHTIVALALAAMSLTACSSPAPAPEPAPEAATVSKAEESKKMEATTVAASAPRSDAEKKTERTRRVVR